MKRVGIVAAIAGLTAGVVGLMYTTDVNHAQDANTWSTLERGLYLTRMGDCAACHTAKPSKPFAGDFPLRTPFGTIYTSNLTPDDETGIGKWTKNDFYRAMHEGKRPDGTRLYPAFPYTHFTLVTREDSDDIFAYLKSLKPIHQEVERPDFPFPLDWRPVVAGWNALNFKNRRFEPRADKSKAWNRGFYIAEGLGHCALCHSPKNLLGAEKAGQQAYTGGMADGWFAPSLRATTRGGIGHWSKQDIVEFLKYGRNQRGAAFGPMAEVITKSTRHLKMSDLVALATYLKDLPHGTKADDTKTATAASNSDAAGMKRGKLVYNTQCAACHAANGKGVRGQFAAMAGSGIVQSSNPTTVIRVILEGAKSVVTDKYPTPQAMPAFDWKLSNEDIAAVATYVRNAFGNSADPVTSDQVAKLRNRKAIAGGEPH